jgi:hypothetical protein
VAGGLGLRNAEDGDQVGHTTFPPGEEGDEPEPGRIRERSEQEVGASIHIRPDEYMNRRRASPPPWADQGGFPLDGHFYLKYDFK